MEDNSQNIESLILKQLHQELTAEEQHQLEQWLSASPTNREEYAALVRIWQDSSQALNDPSFDTAAAWGKVSEKLQTTSFPTAPIGPKMPAEGKGTTLVVWFKWIAAACLLAGVAGWWFFATHERPREKMIFAGYANRVITFPDSSTIYLRKGSTITFPDALSDGRGERVAQLKGEAFFEVRHDPARPFRVSTGEATIEDLGTSFVIRQDNTSCRVQVIAGTVKCSARTSPEDSIILIAGQQARLVEGNWVRYRQADPNALSWKSQTLAFKQSPLDSVLSAVQDLYGIPLTLSPDLRERAADIRVTARFNARQPLRDVLDEISVLTGLGIIQKKDTMVFFQKML